MIVSYAPPPPSKGVHTLQYVGDEPGAGPDWRKVARVAGYASAAVTLYAIAANRPKLQRVGLAASLLFFLVDHPF